MARPSDLTFRQLEYLVALADTLGFHRAAAKAHVSQPALSAQIQQVESVLGVRLFERDHRKVLLTPAGGEAVARARRILLEAEDLLGTARRWKDPFHGSWRLGVIPTVAPYLLPEVLPALTKAHPDLRLLLREERTPVLMRELESGGLEAAILADDPSLGELACAPLKPDPFLLAAPPFHPVARKAKVALRDLKDAPLLLLEDGHCLRGQALAFCGEAGVKEVDFRASSLPTLVQMVAAGQGLTLLPRLCAGVEGRRAAIALRPFVRPVPGRRLVLAWRKGSPLAEALETFAGEVRAAWPVENDSHADRRISRTERPSLRRKRTRSVTPSP